MRRWLILAVLLAAAILLPPGISQARDCTRAAGLFNQAKRNLGSPLGEDLLRRAVAACPSYAAQAYYQYALSAGNQGRLGLAAKYYHRALQAKPELIAAYAGLGDVRFTQGRFAQAAAYYQRFLDGLATEKAKGDPARLARFEAKYRQKMAKVTYKAGVHVASLTGVVDSQAIVRGLTAAPGVRGVGGLRQRERLTLSSIHFAYDSARIGTGGLRQVAELARALNSEGLKHATVLIEGYTDSYGGADYNLRLSQRRAESVKQACVARGVAASRLRAVGKGKSKLLVATGGKEEQAPNRRVEFVNLGE